MSDSVLGHQWLDCVPHVSSFGFSLTRSRLRLLRFAWWCAWGAVTMRWVVATSSVPFVGLDHGNSTCARPHHGAVLVRFVSKGKGVNDAGWMWRGNKRVATACKVSSRPTFFGSDVGTLSMCAKSTLITLWGPDFHPLIEGVRHCGGAVLRLPEFPSTP